MAKSAAYQYRPPRVAAQYQVTIPALQTRPAAVNPCDRSQGRQGCERVWCVDVGANGEGLVRLREEAMLLTGGAPLDEEQLLHFWYAHQLRHDRRVEGARQPRVLPLEQPTPSSPSRAPQSQRGHRDQADRAVCFLRATAGSGHLGSRLPQPAAGNTECAWFYGPPEVDANGRAGSAWQGTGTDDTRMQEDRRSWTSWLTAARVALGQQRVNAGAKASGDAPNGVSCPPSAHAW